MGLSGIVSGRKKNNIFLLLFCASFKHLITSPQAIIFKVQTKFDIFFRRGRGETGENSNVKCVMEYNTTQKNRYILE